MKTHWSKSSFDVNNNSTCNEDFFLNNEQNSHKILNNNNYQFLMYVISFAHKSGMTISTIWQNRQKIRTKITGVK